MHIRIPSFFMVFFFSFSGLSCDDDLARQTTDPCQDVLCENGTCVVEDQAAVCDCETGYHAEGLSCVQDASLCDQVDCSGHGTCVTDLEGNATCDCDDGYVADGLTCIWVDILCGNGVVESGEQCDPPDGVTCDELCALIQTTPAPVGDPCTAAADCLGDYCIEDGDGWPEGYCTQVDCDASEAAWETSCDLFGGDGLCLEMSGYTLCFDRCDPLASDCRTGYECVDIGDGFGICTPEPVCGNGFVESGEECDPPGADCTAECQGTGTAIIGELCVDATECAGNYCFTDDQGWPEGYCTYYECDASDATWETSCLPFGGDGLCLDVGGYGMCFDSCDPTAPDCRTGYECLEISEETGVCYPEPVCGNAIIESGEECDPPGADCTAECQGTGTAIIGDLCVDATECARNYCITDDQGWPDGYCTQYDCDASDANWEISCAPYGGDGLCLDMGGYGMCFDGCDPAAPDCRVGYECIDLGGGDGVCYPEPVCGNGFVESGEECDPPGADCTAQCQGTGAATVGDLCVDATECAGDLCITDDQGWPDGYCSQYDCDASEANWETSCLPYGGDALCLDMGGYGMCLDRCNPVASDCRAGYECLDLGGGYGVCYPEPVCGNGFVESGEECDPPGADCTADCQGTGTALVGAPCTSAADCEGNWCLSEADGYPLGYCVFAGCDLVVPNSCVSHGADSICVNFGTPTEPYGVCMDGCSPGPGACRTDYSCSQLSPGVRICQP